MGFKSSPESRTTKEMKEKEPIYFSLFAATVMLCGKNINELHLILKETPRCCPFCFKVRTLFIYLSGRECTHCGGLPSVAVDQHKTGLSCYLLCWSIDIRPLFRHPESNKGRRARTSKHHTLTIPLYTISLAQYFVLHTFENENHALCT